MEQKIIHFVCPQSCKQAQILMRNYHNISEGHRYFGALLSIDHVFPRYMSLVTMKIHQQECNPALHRRSVETPGNPVTSHWSPITSTLAGNKEQSRDRVPKRKQHGNKEITANSGVDAYWSIYVTLLYIFAGSRALTRTKSYESKSTSQQLVIFLVIT